MTGDSGTVLIRGGTLVDGSGAPPRTADVLIRRGRIADVGASLSDTAARVIDAHGLLVSPGFIDSHTHFDASLFWDPMCSAMLDHGVTTLLIGNCSLGLAPVRPERREELASTFGFIEDIPKEVFVEKLPWTWQSFGEYASEMAMRRFGPNVCVMVPHSLLRLETMGDAAWQRAANADEIAAMAAVLDEALAAGGQGLSISLFDKDADGRWVPSYFADDAELDALYAVMGRHRAISQLVPRNPDIDRVCEDFVRFSAFARTYDVPLLINAVGASNIDPTRPVRFLANVHERRAEGAPIWPMLSPRPLELRVNFHQNMCFTALPTWNALVQERDMDRKRTQLNDPEWRAVAREEWDTEVSFMFPTALPGHIRVIETGTDLAVAGDVGKSLADIAARHGGHPSDALAEWVLKTGFRGEFVVPMSNTDLDAVARIARDPAVLFGASDAGAHLQMFCGCGDTTLLFTRHVRDRTDLSIEEAVYGFTGKQAEVLRLNDRGVIRPGAVADVNIFALDELVWERESWEVDPPAGIPRFRRPPGGYRYTLLGGKVVCERGKQTGDLEGRYLPLRGA